MQAVTISHALIKLKVEKGRHSSSKSSNVVVKTTHNRPNNKISRILGIALSASNDSLVGNDSLYKVLSFNEPDFCTVCVKYHDTQVTFNK
jgi:hypothetical protein